MLYRYTSTKAVTDSDDPKEEALSSVSPVPSKSPDTTDSSKALVSTNPNLPTLDKPKEKSADSADPKPPTTPQFHPDTPAPLKEFFPPNLKIFRDGADYGRGWLVEELRLKSNLDLHKLWYVLLKEMNLLLTVEYQAEQRKAFIKKGSRKTYVEQSMLNLKQVLKEREEVIQGAFQLQAERHGEDIKTPVPHESPSLFHRIMKFFRMR